MKKDTIVHVIQMFMVAFAFIIGMALPIFLLDFGKIAEASPPPAPTPIADIIGDVGNVRDFTFQSATAIAADTNTSAFQLVNNEFIDIQATIDQGTVNTTTLTIQYSNDNSNWDDGMNIVASNAADATVMTRVPMFGRWARVKQDLTNTNTITITILALAK